jgi:zinc/manganese transport system substrate-binding protein/manganese/iron transport system substrate-binding protein
MKRGMRVSNLRVRARGVRACAALLLLVLAACGTETGQQTTPGVSGGKLSIVTTTTQIRSMTEAVIGDRATVRSIMSAGSDPHEYEPTASDVQAIVESALVLENGIGLDSWADRLIANAGGERPVVTVTEGIPLRGAEGEEGEAGEDPHVWFSVTNAMTMTRNIRDALVRVDPANASAYQANADTYLAKLDELDKYIVAQVATIPKEDRKMVTNHDAFGYFIERYGLTFVGSIIPSMSTGAQPSARDVADIITKLRQEKVKAIFLESSINPTLAQQIGEDTGVKVVDTLYGDTLGAPGTPGADYLGMMRYNADTIVAALR